MKQAFILAGGLGTRLRSVLPDRPKCLAEVNDRPFITYLFDQLKDAGIEEIILCIGHFGEQVIDAFGESYRDIRLFYSREEAPLGTGGAFCNALHLAKPEPFLALNGDAYCDIDLQAFIDWFQPGKMQAALALMHMEDCRRFGRVEIDGGERIVRFDEKSPDAPPGWINGGIYILSKELLSPFCESLPSPISIERDVFPKLIGHGFYGRGHRGRFIDIGTPESFAAAEAFFKALPDRRAEKESDS